MFQFIAILLVVGLLVEVAKALNIILLYVVFPVVAFFMLRRIYYAFNPKKEQPPSKGDVKKAEEDRKRKEQEEAERKKRQEQEDREAKARRDRDDEVNRRKDFERQQHRDSDQQVAPYTYKIGKHGNESLAIRYGIANQERKVKEYWYHDKGGERKRNPDRDRVFYEPANMIRLQKTRKIGKDLYEVVLTDFRDRKARAIIEVGTEYVKTFYPLDDRWFEKHADLEEVLKGNNSFTLKELAIFHVQKTVGV